MDIVRMCSRNGDLKKTRSWIWSRGGRKGSSMRTRTVMWASSLSRQSPFATSTATRDGMGLGHTGQVGSRSVLMRWVAVWMTIIWLHLTVDAGYWCITRIWPCYGTRWTSHPCSPQFWLLVIQPQRSHNVTQAHDCITQGQDDCHPQRSHPACPKGRLFYCRRKYTCTSQLELWCIHVIHCRLPSTTTLSSLSHPVEHTLPKWDDLWSRYGRFVFRSTDIMDITIPVYMKMLHEKKTFDENFFEIRKNKPLVLMLGRSSRSWNLRRTQLNWGTM